MVPVPEAAVILCGVQSPRVDRSSNRGADMAPMRAVLGMVLAFIAGRRSKRCAGRQGRAARRLLRLSAHQFVAGADHAGRNRANSPAGRFVPGKAQRLQPFRIVAIPPEIGREIATGPEISGCNGCERDFARRIGANWAAWGTVQKVSNLILNINVYVEDAEAGKMEFVRSVDIRGNTDEFMAAWAHLSAAQLSAPRALIHMDYSISNPS